MWVSPPHTHSAWGAPWGLSSRAGPGIPRTVPTPPGSAGSAALPPGNAGAFHSLPRARAGRMTVILFDIINYCLII